MRGFIKRLLGAPETKSKDDAKHRLQVLLIHDQVDLSAAQMENMRLEIIEVVSRYVEIDAETMDFRLEKEDGHIALVSNLPVLRVTSRAAAAG
ncbi:MAG: cell division topological specificity factor [Kiritimatiellia bacterium]|jgi:cell division topological specificity factor